MLFNIFSVSGSNEIKITVRGSNKNERRERNSRRDKDNDSKPFFSRFSKKPRRH